MRKKGKKGSYAVSARSGLEGELTRELTLRIQEVIHRFVEDPSVQEIRLSDELSGNALARKYV